MQSFLWWFSGYGSGMIFLRICIVFCFFLGCKMERSSWVNNCGDRLGVLGVAKKQSWNDFCDLRNVLGHQNRSQVNKNDPEQDWLSCKFFVNTVHFANCSIFLNVVGCTRSEDLFIKNLIFINNYCFKSIPRWYTKKSKRETADIDYCSKSVPGWYKKRSTARACRHELARRTARSA